MAEHRRAAHDKNEEAEKKNRVRRQESKPLTEQHDTDNENGPSLTDTPFNPRMEEHAITLSGIHSSVQRQDFIKQLNQTYGMRYAQGLVESVNVQAKLTVSDPSDVYEQEADRVAETVTQSLQSQVTRQAVEEEEETVQAKTILETQRQELPEEEELQAQSVESHDTTVSESIETRINNASGGGQPLADSVKNPMETAFGAEFGGVRVHNDSEADVLNQQLGARAFTTGNDIFFRADEYSPGSDSGKKLIAHELTHVIQQTGKKATLKEDVSRTEQGKVDTKENATPVSDVLQRKPVPGLTDYGNFVDMGNGLFGTTQPTDAGEVSGLVDEIRAKTIQAGLHQNIKVITGTHGDVSGHLVGEQMFYSEDLVHEGHKVAEAGWINVLNVKGKSKDTIEHWMTPESSVIILAWCYSKTSKDNWENVHCYKNEVDYQTGTAFW